jgi:4-hydroxybenzoate polyprenyltransferase
VHPFPSLVVAGLTAALVVLADHEAALGTVLLLSVGMLCYQFCIGVTNDIVDAADDSAAKPWKPIPAGLVSRRTAIAAAMALWAAGMALTAPEGVAALLLGAAAAGCGIAYDLYFKRTRLSWLPYAVAFPLLPIWVFAAVDEWGKLLWWVLPLGAALGFALHLANQAPDVEDDRRAGIASAGQMLGSDRSRSLAVAVFAAVAVVACVVLTPATPGRAIALGGVGAAGFVIAVFAVGRLGRDGLFGVLALGAAAISVVFLSAV